MITAKYNCLKDLPKEFYHESTFGNICGWTVAMCAVGSGHI